MEYLYLIGALFGGVVIWFITFLVLTRGRKIDRYAENLLSFNNEDLRLRVERAESNAAGYIKQLAGKDKEIHWLRAKLTLLELTPFDSVPIWMKNQTGLIDHINKAYEKEFLVHRHLTVDDCIGKTEFEIMDKETANEHLLTDSYVVKTGEVWAGPQNFVDGLGRVSTWQVVKFKRKIPPGIVSMAFPV